MDEFLSLGSGGYRPGGGGYSLGGGRPSLGRPSSELEDWILNGPTAAPGTRLFAEQRRRVASRLRREDESGVDWRDMVSARRGRFLKAGMDADTEAMLTRGRGRGSLEAQADALGIPLGGVIQNNRRQLESDFLRRDLGDAQALHQGDLLMDAGMDRVRKRSGMEEVRRILGASGESDSQALNRQRILNRLGIDADPVELANALYPDSKAPRFGKTPGGSDFLWTDKGGIHFVPDSGQLVEGKTSSGQSFLRIGNKGVQLLPKEAKAVPASPEVYVDPRTGTAFYKTDKGWSPVRTPEDIGPSREEWIASTEIESWRRRAEGGEKGAQEKLQDAEKSYEKQYGRKYGQKRTQRERTQDQTEGGAVQKGAVEPNSGKSRDRRIADMYADAVERGEVSEADARKEMALLGLGKR